MLKEEEKAEKMSTSFSLSRGSGSSRLQFGGAMSQRQRSLSMKKPPEPLRRAVADCLSSSSSLPSSSLHGNPSIAASEAGRTLRDYIATPSTMDIAYCVLLEHALAERDRSPAVVSRCVTLLKRFLLRYVPGEQTLLQIDLFCLNSIAECDAITSRRVSPWLKSLDQQSAASVASGSAIPSSLSSSSFATGALVKSVNYVRSLVARHLPRRPLPPATFAVFSSASRQSLPTLSSLLSKSFNYQLSPVPINSRESPERPEVSSSSALNLSSPERIDGEESNKYIAIDVLKWRWTVDREQQLSSASLESDGVTRTKDVHTHSFLEVGAAALFIGDMEAKMKSQPWKYSGTRDTADLDQLLQPSAVTCTSNFSLDHSHLRQITASKRTRSGPHQVWDDVSVGTFRPRARRLFQYRHYSEQQPLRLNPAEVHEVIAAVCSESSSVSVNHMNTTSRLTNHSGKPSMDVAISVLIKLVIDMYVSDSQTAAPLTLSMLEDMLKSPRVASRVRAFDLILNLGVHAHLLEPVLPDDPPTIEEEPTDEMYLSNDGQPRELVKKSEESDIQEMKSLAIDNFESWILSILCEILLLLVQTEEREEIVWSSALSCLVYFVCDRGKIWKNRLEGLDIRVIKVLLQISREHSWAEVVHCKLICMLTNMFYEIPDGPVDTVSSGLIFISERIDLLGGIEFICLEYSQANSREEKRNLFAVLLDYVLHQVNEMCLATEGSTYSFDEIQPLATMLTLADAPEAFYIAVKHGLEGIGEILRGSVSEALSRYPNFERLNVLLEKIMRKFDATISTFTCLDDEFSNMMQTTKSYKFFESMENGLTEIGVVTKVKLSWATLHSLLHSEQSAYRHNGYIWLVELLVSEISEVGESSIWVNINNLLEQIVIAGSQDSSTALSVPLPILIMCGLLKSKYNYIRWGFLFVLEKLLMRLKLLLDENELQHVGGGDVKYNHSGNRLEKANAVIDIMSSALSLVSQINETDRINILKMCDMLFSQLCLRVFPVTDMPLGDLTSIGNIFGCKIDDRKSSRDLLGHLGSRTSPERPVVVETASMAALLLRGYAFVPMQLVERVPTSLFYWPLIQLAGAATDDIALGVAVGSKGDGNLPGATSDIRAALLLLLIGKCSDPAAFQEVGGDDFFRELLDDTDSRVAYYSSAFLLKRMMTEEPEKYQRMLQNLIFKAQQSNNEKLLENPYLQMRGILQLSNDLGTPL